MSKKRIGIAASDGISIAKAYLFKEPKLTFDRIKIKDATIEKSRFHKAVLATKKELHVIRQSTLEKMGEGEAAIFDAHQMLLTDPELLKDIERMIEKEYWNAETALWETTEEFIHIFESMEDNDYMKERATDIRDVRKRLLAQLLGVSYPDPSTIQEKVILIADDLTPSDTALLDKEYIQAFVTSKGGSTSHTAIMARSLEIPAVVGMKEELHDIKNGDILIVDGTSGSIWVNPSEEDIAHYQSIQVENQQIRLEWHKLLNEPSITQDGKQVELAANIGSLEDLKSAKENGAESIGLFRTEFIYMNATELPDEESQFDIYKEALGEMEGKSVIVRTMDVGGDKVLPYLNLPKELNPFLGYRAIRMSIEESDVFRTQLRALLRASAYGKLGIMFPMIATLEELKQAKAILTAEKALLLSKGIDVSEDIEIGIMIETPAAALLADYLAKEVDFFSIGTNDLIQYTMAADRLNERVSYLYQPYHPAILRLVKQVIDAGHKEGKWVGMCGEMAGDPIAVPLLVGMGLDEYSMSATSILKTRAQLKKLDSKKMKEIAHRALYDCATNHEVRELVKKELLLEN